MIEYITVKDLIKRYNDTIEIEKDKHKHFNQKFIKAVTELYKFEKMLDEDNLSLEDVVCIVR